MVNPSSSPAPLFSTSRLAGEAAARASGGRRRRILAILSRGPAAIFEVAAQMGLFDHQISGRFGELEREGLITKTGERRKKPETGCEAEMYRMAEAGSTADRATHFPATLLIEGEAFDRQSPDGGAGVPYARRSDGGGLSLIYRVGLPECERCGRPLTAIEDEECGRKSRRFACGTPGCGRVWRLLLVREPGREAVLALVGMTG